MMRRKFGIALACVLSTIVGVAAASSVVPAGQDTIGGPDDLQPDGGAVTQSDAVPDPGGGPAWAVRVYHSESGKACPELGRLGPGGFGTPGPDGRVRPLPVEAAGSCTDLDRDALAMALNRYPTESTAVLFGDIGGRVRRIDVVDSDGAARNIDIQASGVFLLPMLESQAERSQYVVQLKDGSVESGRLVRQP